MPLPEFADHPTSAMTLNPDNRQLASQRALMGTRPHALALCCALCLGLATAPAWADTAKPRAASSAHKAHHAKPAKADRAPQGYVGRFSSECDEMAVGLYTRDIVELAPLAPQRIEAKYHKAIFTTPTCEATSRLGTLHLPVAIWQIDGPVKATPGADRVTVHMPEGLITATVDQPDKMKETDQSWVLTIGREQVPIDKLSAATQERDIRLLEGDVLFFGDPGSPDAENYPQEALRNHPLKRSKPTPAAP